jgi:DNA-binding transcriptional ArsR family regulator
MSHYMTALAMKQTGLKPAAKIVLYWLADHYNGETGECFPSQKRMAVLCEMTDRSVRKQIDFLQQAGLVEVIERKRPNGSQTSNAYRLKMDNNGRKNIPGDMENISTPSRKIIPTHNPVNNNLVNLTLYTFDEAWTAYPRKIGKAAARKAWEKATAKVSPDVLSAKLAEYVDSLAGADPRYIPHLATWLNGERWEDEVAPRQQSGFRSMVAELAMGGE